ncbi:HAD hydrolase-like protein [Leptolyngbya sp. AN03gr2]|uniref:HAD hydrolase-like protein n=1 Tax=unclassified Leptolyngbya TaxID=2650499 RepID=UPI003D323A58
MNVILFDFDGTIVDSVDAGIKITNRLAHEFGFPPFDQATLDELKNLGSRAALKRSQIPVWKLPFLIRRFTEELNREIPHLKLFPEMQETLLELKHQGNFLGIVSTNSIKNIQQFLRVQNLTSTFDVISANYSLFGKSRLIQKIIRQQKLQSSRIYYVGDETRDIEAAKKSGVNSIAATWGINSAEILLKYHPDFLINCPTELRNLFIDKA